MKEFTCSVCGAKTLGDYLPIGWDSVYPPYGHVTYRLCPTHAQAWKELGQRHCEEAHDFLTQNTSEPDEPEHHGISVVPHPDYERLCYDIYQEGRGWDCEEGCLIIRHADGHVLALYAPGTWLKVCEQ